MLTDELLGGIVSVVVHVLHHVHQPCGQHNTLCGMVPQAGEAGEGAGTCLDQVTGARNSFLRVCLVAEDLVTDVPP